MREPDVRTEIGIRMRSRSRPLALLSGLLADAGSRMRIPSAVRGSKLCQLMRAGARSEKHTCGGACRPRAACGARVQRRGAQPTARARARARVPHLCSSAPAPPPTTPPQGHGTQQALPSAEGCGPPRQIQQCRTIRDIRSPRKRGEGAGPPAVQNAVQRTRAIAQPRPQSCSRVPFPFPSRLRAHPATDSVSSSSSATHRAQPSLSSPSSRFARILPSCAHMESRRSRHW